MRFNRITAVGEPEPDDYDPSNIRCPDCGHTYSGTDGAGGHCRAPRPDGGYCCMSFGSLHAFDKHRTGPYDPPGQRRCLTPDELRAKNWRQDERGQWRTPAPETNPWKKDTP